MVAISGHTFVQVVVTFHTFYTITTGRSGAALDILQCGQACVAHGTCGGFVWDATEVSGEMKCFQSESVTVFFKFVGDISYWVLSNVVAERIAHWMDMKTDLKTFLDGQIIHATNTTLPQTVHTLSTHSLQNGSRSHTARKNNGLQEHSIWILETVLDIHCRRKRMGVSYHGIR